MNVIDLNGRWTLSPQGRRPRSAGRVPPVKGRVPGDVVSDLLQAKRIPDPYYRENERDVQWIGECDWVYEREFNAPAALLRKERVLLQCDPPVRGRWAGCRAGPHTAWPPR